ncbi:MAG: 16S rRNA (uracil(1498)-N(3))-methyltransferase [Pseudomonadota bacterium]
MRSTRIYTPQPLKRGANIQLETNAAQHLTRVLRMRPGDQFVLFDGSGVEFNATIEQCDTQRVVIEVQAERLRESPPRLRIHLGMAISRGERMDWIMQKSTELGVTAITPLLTERTQVKLSSKRVAKKLSHWRQITISACEQSGRCLLPDLDAPMPLRNWLPLVDTERRLLLHPSATEDETTLDLASVPGSVSLLIGPEGGFSATELATARAQGFHALKLGPRVLRTETAPLAAIAFAQTLWGDMRP